MNGKYVPALTATKDDGESSCGITNRNSGFTFDFVERHSVGKLRIYIFAITVSSTIAVWSDMFGTSGSSARVVGILSKSQSFETAELYREGNVKTSTEITTGSWRGFMIMYG